jgi:hypothetical protein
MRLPLQKLHLSKGLSVELWNYNAKLYDNIELSHDNYQSKHWRFYSAEANAQQVKQRYSNNQSKAEEQTTKVQETQWKDQQTNLNHNQMKPPQMGKIEAKRQPNGNEGFTSNQKRQRTWKTKLKI